MILKKIGDNRIRKSGFEDMFFVMVMIIAFAFFFIFLNKMSGSIKEPLATGLSSAMPADSPVNVTNTMEQTDSSTTTYNKLFPFLLIGLFGFVFITGGFIMQHPIMLVVGIILLGVGVILAVVYANVYNQITNTSEMTSTTAKFPIQNAFLKYLPFVVVLLIVIIAFALLLRKSGGGGGGY